MRSPLTICIGTASAVLDATQAGPGSLQATPTVSSVAATATDTFVDAAARGRDENEFKDKWIRFVSSAHPEGFLTRVKSFDPATGRFTL